MKNTVMTMPVSILLVDDDADDRELFIESLQEINAAIICHTAKNGEEALMFLTSDTTQLPAYIFLDLRMPKLDGRQCLEKIKRNKALKDIPVIVYTTSNDVDDAKELQELGATHFVTKPVNPREIYYLISLVLEEIEPYHS